MPHKKWGIFVTLVVCNMAECIQVDLNKKFGALVTLAVCKYSTTVYNEIIL